MFFGLNNVYSHPCFKMQEVANALLWAAVINKRFGPKIFPAWFAKTYSGAPAVQKKLRDVHTALLRENLNTRQSIYSQFINNNAIELICSDTGCTFDGVISWNSQPGKVLKELMIMLYSKLDLAVFKISGCKKKPLQRYYSEFIKANTYVCPFCFINQYKNRLSPKREDLDHYFCKSVYPLAEANMENLVPMCGECNQTYKKEERVAENGGLRVAAFYPYSNIPSIELRISCVRYPAPEDLTDNGEWLVELICSDVAQQSKVDNWDRVFDIRNRIACEASEFHQEWIQGRLQDEDPGIFPDLPAFRAYLLDSSDREYSAATRRMEPKTLLKAALYRFLAEDGEAAFLESFMRQYEREKTVAA